MAKEEIGFKHGIPENRDKTWEKQISGQTFIFKKALQRKGLFLYGCEIRSADGSSTTASKTGFYSERDLKPEEVEHLPQFANFIQGYLPVRALRAASKP
jgi:hypothetical protein